MGVCFVSELKLDSLQTLTALSKLLFFDRLPQKKKKEREKNVEEVVTIFDKCRGRSENGEEELSDNENRLSRTAGSIQKSDLIRFVLSVGLRWDSYRDPDPA